MGVDKNQKVHGSFLSLFVTCCTDNSDMMGTMRILSMDLVGLNVILIEAVQRIFSHELHHK